MTVNAATLTLVKNFEGFVNHAYPDPVSGGEPWTIGYGHTSSAGPPVVTRGMQITMADGEAILAADLANVEAAVRALIDVAVNDNQLGACVSLAFNVGVGAFRQSTLLKKLNAGDYAGAQQEFARWNHAGGQVVAGLTRRRSAEAALFATPVEAPTQPVAKPQEPAPAPQVPPAPPKSTPEINFGGIFGALINFVISLLKGLLK